MTRALILNAVSTPEQAKKTSLQYQSRLARELCRDRGWTIVGELFSDTSRSLHDRIEDIAEKSEAFQNLWIDIQNRNFDWLVVHSFDRLNRDPALIVFLIQRIVKSGARIWSHLGGEVNRTNYINICSSILMMVSLPVQINVEKTKTTKLELAERGLFPGFPPHYYEVERDERGRRLRTMPRASVRPYYVAAALMLVEQPDLNYDEWESLTAQKYGIPLQRRNRFYSAFVSPSFWGNIAIGAYSDNKVAYTPGAWIFDPSLPAPPAVTVLYAVNEAILEQELGEQVKSILRQRFELGHGRHIRQNRRMFSGLLICAECQSRLIVTLTRPRPKARRDVYYVSYRCSNAARKAGCTASQIIESRVKTSLDQRLRELIAGQNLALISAAAPHQPADGKLLEDRQRQLQHELDGLLRDKATAVDFLQTRYTALIAETADQLQATQQALRKLQAANLRDHSGDAQRTAALNELTVMTLDRFWQLPAPQINVLLLRLFGQHRVVVKGGQVVGIALSQY